VADGAQVKVGAPWCQENCAGFAKIGLTPSHVNQKSANM
jgi:hypothetical protein